MQGIASRQSHLLIDFQLQGFYHGLNICAAYIESHRYPSLRILALDLVGTIDQ